MVVFIDKYYERIVIAMARPHIKRTVCYMPDTLSFSPIGQNISTETGVIMTVDEYETIRLIDYEGYTQQECAEYMNVARTTIQLIYNDARKKLADMLINGKSLNIDGGSFVLRNNINECLCNCKGCHRKRYSTNNSK